MATETRNYNEMYSAAKGDVAAQMGVVKDFIREVLIDGGDYGLIPNTKKPTLYKSGAEKLISLIGAYPSFEIMSSTEEWQGEYSYMVSGGYNKPMVEKSQTGVVFYSFKCILLSRDDDKVLGFGFGSCGSAETKWLSNSALANANTCLKMAKKRCLGSTTPVFVLSKSGLMRTNMSKLYGSWEASISAGANNKLYLPGVDGGWREVKGMIRDESKPVKNIVLRSGLEIKATDEHRFPTANGLKDVSELRVGDFLLRGDIGVPDKFNSAWSEFGFISGAFIGDGSFATPTCVRFTLNPHKDGDIINRVKAVAEHLGATTYITDKTDNCISLNVSGQSFIGMIKTFVAGDKGENKHLTKESWRQGAKFLSEMLNGYLSTDGHYAERRGRNPHYMIGFTRKNYELANDLRSLGNLLGFKTVIRKGQSTCEGKTFPTWVGTMKESKLLKYNQKDMSEIVSIEGGGLATVYDVEVDGDHLFCLADGTQTHNSSVDSALSATNCSDMFTQDVEDMDISKREDDSRSDTPASSSTSVAKKPDVVEKKWDPKGTLLWGDSKGKRVDECEPKELERYMNGCKKNASEGKYAEVNLGQLRYIVEYMEGKEHPVPQAVKDFLG